MGGKVTDQANLSVHERGLLLGRSRTDGRLIYPMPLGDEAAGYEPVILPRHGRLWSWALKRHRPRGVGLEMSASPSFTLGYVELDGGMMVEGRLLLEDEAALHQGLELELTIEAESDGTKDCGVIFTYVFRPVAK